ELTGTWEPVSAFSNGQERPGEKTKLSFDSSGKAKRRVADMDVPFGTTDIDPTANPMTIDVISTTTEVAKKTLGIYKLEGDRLTTCFAAAGKKRPKKFSSEAGSGNELVTYKRAKIDEPRKPR